MDAIGRNRLLAREMLVHGTQPHAGQSRDIAYGQARIALLQQKPNKGIQDGLLREPGALLFRLAPSLQGLGGRQVLLS